MTAMRPETTSEHIARDMREGRFPERSEPQMVLDLAAVPAQVTVKPLVWRQQSHDCYVAETAFGSAAVQNESHALAPDRWGWWMVGSYEDDSPSGYAVTIEAAKTAAQADYEAHILAAIDVQPAPRDEAIARLVEALDNLLEATTAEDRFHDRSLTITGPTYNLKWLLEAEEDARTALAAAKAVQQG